MFSCISPTVVFAATDSYIPVTFWEYVYRYGFSGGDRPGGFGGGGFGGSGPDDWTSSDDMKSAYDDYVSTLPAQGYDSAGTLLWQLNFNDAITLKIFVAYSNSYDLKAAPYKKDFTEISCSGGLLIYDFARQAYHRFDCGVKECTYTVPVTGLYVRQSSPSVKSALYGSGDDLDVLVRNETYYTAGSQNNFVAGKTYTFSTSSRSSNNSGGRVVFYAPVYKVYPADQSLITNNYYISTRVNNFNGDYYDSVTNNYYNNTTIVNETTNNYYDMTTNNNYTMSNWSYDYASRTYFITLEDGTTVTVQFGDDCMTITKNDVTNSYQYVIKNNSTPDTPTGCKHDWTETIDTAPTCLEGGHASYTCSLCGETYEQILSAKGHNWQVIEHVNMVYNSDGSVATPGHTLYQCSVCGEQWYTDTGAPPPDVSGSSNILAWLQSFQAWLDEKLDSLFSAADAVIVTKLDALIEKSSDTIVNVIEDDTYIPNVFYLDESNGAVDTTKDGISLFADLVRWLWTNVFDGAFDAADITKLDGLFYDPTEVITDGS